MHSMVTAFISRRWSVPREAFEVEIQPLLGGLESAVALARITPRGDDVPLPERFVIKRLPIGFEREAAVYEMLWRHYDSPPAVRVLGSDRSALTNYLYLEEAQRQSAWPWTDTTCAAAVCDELARLHDTTTVPSAPFEWNYESELLQSARATYDIAVNARDTSGQRFWRRVGDLKRVITALPAIRHRLLSRETAIIHGDMHPGNVILRSREHVSGVILIDWARARIGSPFEDIASWLHSLGCWEPQARRRHDSLMRAYLQARAVRRTFDADTRTAYWHASVSNGLSGAIRYHLATLTERQSSESARYDSRRALVAWERVVRRAAALLSTSWHR